MSYCTVYMMRTNYIRELPRLQRDQRIGI